MVEQKNPPSPPLILVVDDEPGVRLLVRASLEQAGFAVEEAENGDRALATFQHIQPDLVILDILMPGLDGFATCRTLRQQPHSADIPILMMTALDDPDSVSRAYEAGATDFVTKPFNFIILAQRVRYMLRACRAFQTLKENQERLAYAQNLAQLGYWEWRPHRDELLISGAVTRLFGSRAQEVRLTLADFLGFIHPRERSSLAAALQAARDAGRPFKRDHRIVLSNSPNVAIAHVQAKAALPESGETPQIIGTIQDITHRKKVEQELRSYRDRLEKLVEERTAQLARVNRLLQTEIEERRRTEEALRESEERFRTIFQGSPIGIELRDRQGRVLEVNPALQEMLGYGEEELRRVNRLTAHHPEDVHDCQRLFQELLAGRRDFYQRECRHVHRGGNTVWVRSQVCRVPGRRGGTSFALAMLQDITWEKQMQEELGAYQERLRSLASELVLAEEKERRRLAADLHDHIGQTLSLAQIKLGALEHNACTPERATEVVEVRSHLRQALNSARSLTLELGVPVLYDLGLEAALEWLAEHFQEQYGLQVVVDSRQPQPPLPEATEVLLFRAVRELVTNIIKHARAQRAVISLEQENGHLYMRVQDDGRGFDPSQMGSRLSKGGGFGLFNIAERLSQIGGLLEVDSEPGRGTSITLRAPLKAEDRLS